MPLMQLMSNKSLFFVTDIDLIRHHVEHITTNISIFVHIPSTPDKLANSAAIGNDLNILSKLMYRLIPVSKRAKDSLSPVENGGYFWPTDGGGKLASKMVVEFMVVSVVALLTTALCDADAVVETKVLSRLLVSDFNKRHFIVRAFGRFYENEGFIGPENASSLAELLLEPPRQRDPFFESFCGECSDEEEFEFAMSESEFCNRNGYFFRLTRVIVIVVINQRIADLRFDQL